MKFIGFFLCLLVTLAADAAELRLLEEKKMGQMPWFHRNGQGLVVEMIDSSDIITSPSPRGGLSLFITSRGKEATVNLEFKLYLPGDGNGIPLLQKSGVKLFPDRTVAYNFLLELDADTINRLLQYKSRYNLLPVTVKVVAADSNGIPIAALVDTAALGFARNLTVSLPQAAVIDRQGSPMLQIDNRLYPGVSGYVGWNWQPARRTIAGFASQGLHLYEIIFQPWSLWKNGKIDAKEFERKINQQINAIVANDPEALIFLRWWLYMPREWAKQHPDERILYDDGSHETMPGAGGWEHASYASEVWRQEYSTVISEAIRRLVRSPYADRIFMIRVGYGNAGEWNNFGYHQQKFPDYSEAMQKKYISWLQRRYSSIENLNRSWGGGVKDWNEIRIPSREDRLATGLGVLRSPESSGNYRDYYRFFSEFTVELIEHFGSIVKQESGNRWLYGVFYGYFAHHLNTSPYHSLDSGHYAMNRLLCSKNVDTICSPYNYLGRENNIGLGMPLASVKAAGKLFLTELDLPTHLGNKDKYTADANRDSVFCHTAQDSVAYYWRDFSRVITWGVGGYWLDFAHDWYLFPEFMELAGKVERVNRLAVTSDNRSVAEIAVLLDEDSVFDLGLSGGSNYGRAIYETLGYTFDAAGAPWDCFLTSDLEKVIRKRYKVIVFANQLRQNERIARLLRDYRGSVLWLYAAGVIKGNKLCQNNDWSGFKVKCITTASGSIFIGGKKASGIDMVTPGMVIDDPAATSLGTFDLGGVGFASKPRLGGINYYFALPSIDASTLRSIYRAAGVHLYANSGTPVYVNAAFIAAFCRNGEMFQLALPKKAEVVVDMWTGRIVGHDTATILIPASSKTPESRLFFYGQKSAVASFMQLF